MLHVPRFAASLLVVLGACALPRAPVPPPLAPPSPAVDPPEPKIAHAIERRPAARNGSAVLLATVDDRTVAYVADDDDGVVRAIDVEGQEELGEVEVGGAPAQIVMLADQRFAVSLRDRGEIVILAGIGTEDEPLIVVKRVDVPAEPIGLAITPDDATLLVASGWGHALTGLATDTLARRLEHTLDREPRAVVVSDDGKTAFVAHAVGAKVDVVALTETAKGPAAVDVTGIENNFERHGFIGERKRTACQGFALAKTDGRIFAPHVLVDPGEANVSSEGGYGSALGRDPELFDVAVIDEDTKKPLAESLTLHIAMHGDLPKCALPRAAAVGRAGLLVACLGTDQVIALDPLAANPHEAERRRWSVPAGPIGIATDDAHDRALVWSQHAHTLTTLATGDQAGAVALASLSIPRRVEQDEHVARGRALFHATGDTRISADGRACASCHPDGRDDGLTWASPGGPRQTPMLAGRLDGAAPYGWTGEGSTVSAHLTKTMQRLRGTGLPDTDKDALIAFVRTMRPPPDSDATADDLVAKGEAIFTSEGTECSNCHGDDGRSPDGNRHNVKSWAEGDKGGAFDTPSLRFAGGSAPYFHDGRYPTLRALLTRSDGKMGHTKHLTVAELDALEAYVRTR